MFFCMNWMWTSIYHTRNWKNQYQSPSVVWLIPLGQLQTLHSPHNPDWKLQQQRRPYCCTSQLSSTLSKSNMVMEYPRFWYALPLYRNIFQMGIPHLTCLHHVVPSYNESAPCRSLLIPGTCQTRRPLSHSDHTSQPRFKWGIWGYFGYTPIFRQTQLKWALQAHFNGGA